MHVAVCPRPGFQVNSKKKKKNSNRFCGTRGVTRHLRIGGARVRESGGGAESLYAGHASRCDSPSPTTPAAMRGSSWMADLGFGHTLDAHHVSGHATGVFGRPNHAPEAEFWVDFVGL